MGYWGRVEVGVTRYCVRDAYRRASVVRITLSPIRGGEADHLLVLSDEYMASLYPAESNHLVSSESLRTGDAAFIGAFLSTELSTTPRPPLSNPPGRALHLLSLLLVLLRFAKGCF